MKSIPDVTGLPLTDAVRRYCEAGLYLVPVRVGKHPGSSVGKGWPEKSSNDPETVLALIEQTRAEGIALHVGKSGMVAFDVDTPERLPDMLREVVVAAPHQRTRAANNGRGHYLFDNGGVDYSNSLGQLPAGWGEIRGKNGVVLLEPSPHPKQGGEYAWVRTGTVPELPAQVAALMTKAADKATAVGMGEVGEFFRDHADENDPKALDRRVEKFEEDVSSGESRHQSMLVALANAMTEARDGLYPADKGADRLLAAFETAMHGERDARGEFFGILGWAVGQAQRERVSVATALAQPVQQGTTVQQATAVQRMARTNTGSMYRMLSQFDGRFVWSPSTKWYAWSDSKGRWEEDAEHRVRASLTRELPAIVSGEVETLQASGVNQKEVGKHQRYSIDCQAAGHQRATLDLLAPMMFVDWEEFDADLNKLTVGNGTLHFQGGTVTLLPHDPEDRITRGTSIDYNPTAQAPFWESTLEMFLPDPEVRRFLQRFAGSILVGGGVREQVLPIMFGTGANGKSTFVNGIRAALGEELAIEVDPATLRQDGKSGSAPSPDKMRLRGARYVYAVEATGHLDAQLLKRLTGGEEIVARPLHGKTISFRPNFTLTIIANEEPEFDDNSEGLWRRVKRIPFDVRIPEANRMDALVVQKLFDEQAEGILAWCIEGYKEYARMGLTPPECVELSSRRMRSDADPVQRFVSERLGQVDGQVLKPTEAWQVWRDWIRFEEPDSEAVKLGATKWKQHVSGILGKPHDDRARVDGKLIRGWVGYALTEDAQESAEYADVVRVGPCDRSDRKPVTEPVFLDSGGAQVGIHTDVTSFSSQLSQRPRVTVLVATHDFSTGAVSTPDAAWRQRYRDKGGQ